MPCEYVRAFVRPGYRLHGNYYQRAASSPPVALPLPYAVQRAPSPIGEGARVVTGVRVNRGLALTAHQDIAALALPGLGHLIEDFADPVGILAGEGYAFPAFQQ